MIRLALLTEIPAPYRIPLFNALAERVDLTVLFLRERHPARPYDLHAQELRFKWRALPGATARSGERWLVLNLGVRRLLREAQVVLVGGWNQPAYWNALLWCRTHRVPAVIWSESTGRDRRSGRHDVLKRRLVGLAAAFVVPGRAAASYLEELGVSSQRITVAPNAVDPAVFGTARRGRDDGSFRILSVARLSPEKGLDVLIDAVRDLPVELVLAGSGPEESRLRRLAGPNVTFLGNVARDALPQIYADADVAVVPSRSDTWGMALNEAALAGLPLVSTTAPGAAYELVEDGVNGFRVEPGDPAALRDAIVRLREDASFRRAAGERSRELALRLTPDRWAAAVAGLANKLAV